VILTPDFIEPTEDRVAIPEARIVKFQYLFDYYDAKEEIIKYIKTGFKTHLIKATYSILGLWLQLRIEFKKKDLARADYKDIEKLDYFLNHRERIPSYTFILNSFIMLQTKLKDLKILDITFPEADISKDFQRSF
jgi:ribosomal protein S18